MKKTYHIIAETRKDKYTIIGLIRAHGGKITDVSGYGSRYLIHEEIEETAVPALDNAIEKALNA